MREMRDTLRNTFNRMFRPENRRKAIRSGTLERIPAFHSEILANDRDLTVYLPPGYQDHPDTRYPVLYMQDGQNLFEAERAFIPGQHWQLREAADQAIGERTARPIIIVGIDNAGAARVDEYTPVRDEARTAGGNAAGYMRMIIEELKPAIDARYRTDPSQTGLGGSSLGGLLTMYGGLAHPEVFGVLAVMSPSVWWAGRAILQTVDQWAGTARPRVWLDIGGREGAEALRDARELNDRLRRRGWSADSLTFHEDRRADHSERAWARRVRLALEFLFPPVAE